jgi:hypothetical protein
MDKVQLLIFGAVFGAVLAGFVGTAGYFMRFGFERWRENRVEERGHRLRTEEESKIKIKHEELHGLELKPAIGHGWWLIRHHEPEVTIRHLQIWDCSGQNRNVSKEFITGTTMSIGGGYGLGVDVHVGDYIEVHWAEAQRDCQDGTRISEAEKSYWLKKDGAGH